MTAIAALEAKFDRLRHEFGAPVGPPVRRKPIPEAPPGLVEVFRMFTALEVYGVRFQAPEEITSREAWLGRYLNENCPLNNPVEIGLQDMTEDVTIGVIKADAVDGHVYHLDGDDYVLLYKNPDITGVPFDHFAPDVVTFFDEWVLGPRYPELMATLFGADVLTNRDRRGRLRDPWARLLIAAGVLP